MARRGNQGVAVRMPVRRGRAAPARPGAVRGSRWPTETQGRRTDDLVVRGTVGRVSPHEEPQDFSRPLAQLAGSRMGRIEQAAMADIADRAMARDSDARGPK